MRRSLIALLLVASACSGGGQEVAPTPPTTALSGPSTTRPVETTTTSTSGPPSTVLPTTTTTLTALTSLSYLEQAAMEFPVQMTALPGADYSYIATKDGRLWAFDGSEVLETPVLDISGSVHNQGERGLLSIAIHPEAPSRFFAHYSDNDGDTVVSEFAFSSPTEIDPSSERVLLTVDQPAGNHNGGMIQVHDGSLFVGLGDGGGANDRFGNGQNTETLLGGLVRIDVEADAEPVLWQYGLRNPWRYWIDDDLIYIADVGQNSFEEVDVAELSQGLNFGWPITEGLHCFDPPSGCDTSGITLPVVEVAHGDDGTCSITGGIVYHGAAIPEIDGHYFYSDYCGGYLRSFLYDDGEATDAMDWTEQVGVAGSVTGFGVGTTGEMYVTTTERLLAVVADRG